MGLNLAECLHRTAAIVPDKTAVVFEETRLSYADLASASMRVADGLRARGVGKGDRVALMLGNTPHFPLAYYGALHLGATVVTLNPGLQRRELIHQLGETEVVALVVWHECLEEAAAAVEALPGCRLLIVVEPTLKPVDPPVGESFVKLLFGGADDVPMASTSPDETAVILYTSAMRGKALGAELTHFNMHTNAEIISRDVLKYYPDDVCMGALPLFHSFGQTCMMNAAFVSQCSLVLVPRFEAHRVCEVIVRDRVSLLAMVPTMFHFVVNYKKDEQLDFSSVRVAISGGAPLPRGLASDFERRFGKPILEGYGLTETSPVVSFNRDAATNRPGSVGTVIPGTEIRVERADGTEAAMGEVGELLIRGKNVMKGYLHAPEVNAETLQQGWLRTGDLGKLDDDGYIYLTGLKKDMVIRAGMNVYPLEVEQGFKEHPDVDDIAVVGVPDAIRGQEVKAFVVLRPGASLTDRELGTWWRERFAAYKCPKRFEFVAALPRTADGHVDKAALRG